MTERPDGFEHRKKIMAAEDDARYSYAYKAIGRQKGSNLYVCFVCVSGLVTQHIRAYTLTHIHTNAHTHAYTRIHTHTSMYVRAKIENERSTELYTWTQSKTTTTQTRSHLHSILMWWRWDKDEVNNYSKLANNDRAISSVFSCDSPALLSLCLLYVHTSTVTVELTRTEQLQCRP